MECPLFPFVSIASHPVTGHQGRGPGLHLLYCPHQVFIHMESVSLNLPQDEQPQLCQPLIYVSCSKSFVISLAFARLTPVAPCLSCSGQPRIGSNTPGVSHQLSIKGKDHCLQSAGNASSNAASDAAGPLLLQGCSAA